MRSALSNIRTLRAETGWGAEHGRRTGEVGVAEGLDDRGLVGARPGQLGSRRVHGLPDDADRGDRRRQVASLLPLHPPGSDMSSSFDSSSDDASGVSLVCEPWSGLRWLRNVSKNTSLGPPDDPRGGRSVEIPLEFVLPSNIAAMAQGHVSETTYDGRPSLTVSCAIAPQPIEGLNMDSHWFDTVAYTVDRATWLVVRTSYLLHGQVVLEQRLTDVRVNEPVSDAQLEPTCPSRGQDRSDGPPLPPGLVRRGGAHVLHATPGAERSSPRSSAPSPRPSRRRRSSRTSPTPAATSLTTCRPAGT